MLSIYCIQIAHHLPKGRNRVKSLFASTSVLVRIGSKLKQSRCKGTCTWEISSVRKWTNLIRCKRIAMMLRRFESYRCYQESILLISSCFISSLLVYYLFYSLRDYLVFCIFFDIIQTMKNQLSMNAVSFQKMINPLIIF